MKKRLRSQFVHQVNLIAEQYGIKIKINWKTAFVDFQGDLMDYEWQNLIYGINTIMKKLEEDYEKTIL